MVRRRVRAGCGSAAFIAGMVRVMFGRQGTMRLPLGQASVGFPMATTTDVDGITTGMDIGDN
jgi:hypothetical protein